MSISDGQTFNSRDLTISWQGTEVVKNYQISLDGEIPSVLSAATVSFADLEEGAHTFTIKPFTDYKDGETKTVDFIIDSITGPGIVLSPRKITSDSVITLTLENVSNFMGAHIEIKTSGLSATLGKFDIADNAKNNSGFIAYSDTGILSDLVIDIGCLKDKGFTGSIVLGSFSAKVHNSGDIAIQSSATYFRDLGNSNIALNGLDFVRVVK
jgi:hypothetical protein